MPLKGVEKVRGRYQALVKEISGPRTLKVVNAIIATGAVMPAPSRGDMLTIGDASYPIKSVIEDDMSAFRAGLNDFTIVA